MRPESGCKLPPAAWRTAKIEGATREVFVLGWQGLIEKVAALASSVQAELFMEIWASLALLADQMAAQMTTTCHPRTQIRTS